MADFIDCGIGAITPEILVRALLSGVTALPDKTCGLRAQDVDESGLTLSKIEVCATKYDLFELFKRALVIGYDGKAAIRTITISSNDGAGLEDCESCANAFSTEELLSSMFVQDQNGVVYMVVINLTT